MVPVYYSPSYISAAFGFDTTRKSGWIAESLRNTPVRGIELVEPDPLTADQVATVHESGYIRAVQTGSPRHLAESQGFPWDSGLWRKIGRASCRERV